MQSNSRVFDEYCKMMAEKEGKVTKTAERRRDPEGISKLYGVTEDSKIIEQAHPETKVIARSEKNEGIVENLIEQNTKSTNIALKSPHGNIPGTPVNKLAARKSRRSRSMSRSRSRRKQRRRERRKRILEQRRQRLSERQERRQEREQDQQIGTQQQPGRGRGIGRGRKRVGRG